MFGKAIKMNLEDLWPILWTEGGVFLLYEIVEAVILFTVKPDTSGAICGAVLLGVGAMMNLFIGSMYPVLNVDYLLRYSVTRKTALLSTLGTMTLNMAVTMGLAGVLGWVDGLIAQAWVRALPWVNGVERVVPPLWAYFAVGLVLVCLSLGAGALLQRFGRKAGWILWGGWMILALGPNLVDWHALDGVNVTTAVMAVAALCGVSLLGGSALLMRTSVRN